VLVFSFEPMTDFLILIKQNGYVIIFLIVLMESIGLPVPAELALIAGGAAAASAVLRVPAVLIVAIAGCFWRLLLYLLGIRMGWVLLGFLCKISVNPETCILRSAESFYKRGGRLCWWPSSFRALTRWPRRWREV